MKPFLNVWSRKAFTLIELLVVITIIGVLSSILLGVYQHVTALSKTVQCVSNMRQLGAATILFTSDNNGTYPMCGTPPWDISIVPYLGGTTKTPVAVLKCPADSRPLVINAQGGQFARSYTTNGVMDNYGICGDTNFQEPSRRVSGLSYPQKTILYAEWQAAGNHQFDGGYSYVRGATDTTSLTTGTLPHGATMNFCFADGHAETMVPAKAIPYWQAFTK